ncbi:potassium channel SKOR-like isoform X1 [Macadamia integrifolia]|uniref:potassium channel SKOR-like isoform X1 n=1 Tax=Macadamia integrifolia TaxID=60698 RepID=UPI001C52B97D|nr:potassium channel SKOR-like isoform X1 [Macadamia integrifolia]
MMNRGNERASREEEQEEEFELEEPRDGSGLSRGNRFASLWVEFSLSSQLSRENAIFNGIRGFMIHPDARWYQAWTHFILIWAIYSSFFTPFEFGFFRGLPDYLFLLDIFGQTAFLVDIVIQFFLAFRDAHTYRIVYDRKLVALRYLKSNFLVDFLGCLPWDAIYKASKRKEEVRYLLWIRLSRARRVTDFFEKMEKDIRINYLCTRIVKLIVVELYYTHTAACIFYYLATTLPPSKENQTWIGSLKMGDYSYSNFRDIDLAKRYITSLYFAVVSMATIGYGDIHAVNVREMVFIMIFVSSDMILGAYLIGNMTALIVKGSKTERFRDKMTDLIKYLNKNKLGKDIRNQIKDHLRLQHESSYTEAAVLQDIPVSIRAKISQKLYKPFIEKVYLFKGCSSEFINQIALGCPVRRSDMNQMEGAKRARGRPKMTIEEVVRNGMHSLGLVRSMTSGSLLEGKDLCSRPHLAETFFTCWVIRLHEEFFLPGEVIMEQGSVIDQLYFVFHGILEEVSIGEDASQEAVSLLQPNSSFGEISILCNIPQPHTVQVRELCRLLRLDKQSFTNILQIYFFDGRTILRNLLEGKENRRLKQLESDITFHIGMQESELVLRVNNAAYHGDLNQLKSLIDAGADPNKTDYDGRSPLHLASSRGYEDIIFFLIQKGVDINNSDKFGNTPLLEAIKNGHDRVASLLVKKGATLNIDDAGNCLCKAVASGDTDYLKLLLSHGIDPNSKDYNHRTPLHIAAAEGLYLTAKILIEAGASVLSKDRWGNTPLDEAHMCGNKNLIKLLEDAKSVQLSKYHDCSQEIQVVSSPETDKMQPRKCTVFPFHPWDPEEKRTPGIVLWITHTIEELIKMASEQLNYSGAACILSEDAGRILDVDMIYDGQKLYLGGETYCT